MALRTGLQPIAGVTGYLRRTETLDQAVREFDMDRLAFADQRAAATTHLIQIGRRARDLYRVSALVFGLAIASQITGEKLSNFAWVIVALTPALIFSARTWVVSARLHATDVEAARVSQDVYVSKVRGLWLTRAARVIPLLERAVTALNLNGAAIVDEEAHEALIRAAAVDKKLQMRLRSSRYVKSASAQMGWSNSIFNIRVGLATVIAMGVVASVIAGFVANFSIGLSLGLLTSWLTAVRFFASRAFVDHRAIAVTRLSLWNRQRDLLADTDKIIRSYADSLVSVYQQDVVIDLRD